MELEKNDIWNLPNGPDVFYFDSSWMLVHLHSNGIYRSYLYKEPDIREGPESKSALAIMNLVRGLLKELN